MSGTDFVTLAAEDAAGLRDRALGRLEALVAGYAALD